MGARPALNNVALSTWGQPFVGEKNKSITVGTAGNAGAAWATGAASGDSVSVSADYGCYDTTQSTNVPPEITNFKDNP